ncbi:MAG: type II toxin-antitoxin system RatA family toxin [Thermomicrobiales bacterium]
MYTETSVVMHGPRERIFALGAAIEDWPLILPHYRAVLLTERTVRPDGTTHKVATMKAWRLLPFGKIPVGWKTIQESNVATGLLHFVHIGGFTKGMDVSWLLTPEEDATRVTITHDFTLKWPLIGGFIAHRIVGQFFVDAIARRTLHCIKARVEENLTPQPPLHRDGEGEQESARIVTAGTPGIPDTAPLSIADKQWRGAGGEDTTRD